MLQKAVWWVRLLTAQKPINSQVGGKEGEVAQSCPTLCDSVDCNLLGFSFHGILQARILEWIAISFSWQESVDKLQSLQLEHAAMLKIHLVL